MTPAQTRTVRSRPAPPAYSPGSSAPKLRWRSSGMRPRWSERRSEPDRSPMPLIASRTSPSAPGRPRPTLRRSPRPCSCESASPSPPLRRSRRRPCRAVVGSYRAAPDRRPLETLLSSSRRLCRPRTSLLPPTRPRSRPSARRRCPARPSLACRGSASPGVRARALRQHLHLRRRTTSDRPAMSFREIDLYIFSFVHPRVGPFDASARLIPASGSLRCACAQLPANPTTRQLDRLRVHSSRHRSYLSLSELQSVHTMPRLIYFPIRGRADPIALLYVDAGAPLQCVLRVQSRPC